jgi:ADP-ribose pyrophosphatase YjhB (NUDIX family)
VLRGRNVLLAKRGKGVLQGLWSPPGGHIEPGEAAEAAALREVSEETGVSAKLSGLLDVHEIIRRDDAGLLTAHYVLLVFYGHWLAGEPVPGDDASAAAFFPVEGLAGMPLTDGAVPLIHRALDKLAPQR